MKRETRKVVVTNSTRINHRMKHIIDMVNSDNHPLEGRARMAGYIEEIWRYLNYKNKVFGKDRNEIKRKNYETSKDLPAAAIMLAHHKRFGNYISNDENVKCFIPKTEDGIKIWDETLIGCISDVYGDERDDEVNDEISTLIVKEENRIKFEQKVLDTRKEAASKTEEKHEAPKPKTEEKHEAPKPKTEEKHEAPKTEEKQESQFTNDDISNLRNVLYFLSTKTVPKSEENEAPKSEKQESPKTEEKHEAPKPKTEEKHEAPKTEKKQDTPKTEEKQEAPKTEDPVVNEHPEDDKPEEPQQDSSVPFEENKSYTDKVYSFSEAMKDCIEIADEVVGDSRQCNLYTENNLQFEGMYPQLEGFTRLLNDNEYLVEYKIYQIPAGNLVMANIADSNNNFIQSLMIDPNVIYRNGYNVLTTTSKTGDYLTEAVAPISDTETILFMAKKRLNQNERRSVMKKWKRPSVTKNVFKMIDFSGLGTREALPADEWEKLVNVLGSVIKDENLMYRAKITDYRNPDKFRLVSDSNCLPMSGKENDIAMIRNDGTTFWVDYDIEKYAEKRYDCGLIPAPQSENN